MLSSSREMIIIITGVLIIVDLYNVYTKDVALTVVWVLLKHHSDVIEFIFFYTTVRLMKREN